MGATARCRGSPSPRRVRRVMGENGLLAPHRVGRNQKAHDGTIVTDKVNEMWETDMSHTVTLKEGRATLRRRRTRELSNHRHSRRAFSQSLRGAGAGPAGGASVLRLHRAWRGAWAQAASRSWPRLHVRRFPGRSNVSASGFAVLRARTEGNGVAERFIRTLKENLLWVRTLKTIEELRAEPVVFARRYNETWLVVRHGYKTPARVREEQTMPRIAIDPTLAAALPLAA